MSVVTVVAKLVVKEEALAKVKAELLQLIDPTRQETGCLEYRLHQDNNDPRVFIFFENWENMGCLERHIAAPHYKHYIAAVDGLIEEKTVHKMTCIA